MTRDEVRKLIGGYATGTLTEAERRMLFEAALDDQEIYDEIAREDALREIIGVPGARERLLRATEKKPAPKAWWVWGSIAAAAAGALLVAVLVRPVPDSSVEVVVTNTQPVPVVGPAPAPEAEVRVATASPANQAEPARARLNGPPPPATAPAEPPKEIALAKTEADQAERLDQADRQQVAVDALPSPLAATAPFVAGAVGQGKGEAATQAQAVAFGFSYEIVNGTLRVTPLVPGVLSVTIETGVGPFNAFASNPVVAQIPVMITVPAQAVEVTIVFGASVGVAAAQPQATQALSGTVTGIPSSELRIAISLN